MSNIEVYQIDNAIPVPGDGLPINQLEVGESFVFPIEKRSQIQVAASTLKRRQGKVFVVRKQNEEFARIWRKA